MALSPNINIMLRAAEKAGRSLIRDFGEVEQLQVSRKGPGDYVSAADRRAEEIIFEELSKARPEYSFLMEESGTKGDQNAEFRWIIDPLDGTSNFLHGIPHWSISIALEHKGEVVAGIIFDPVKDETFRAEKGTGAFVRNLRLRVSGRTEINTSMIAAGQPKHDTEAIDLFMKEYATVFKKSGGVRRYGSAALDLAYVAAGRYEAYWERYINAWDVAAGALIVREAGGIVSQIDGRTDAVHGNNILAGNQAIYGEMKTLLAGVKKQRDAA